MEDCIFVEVYVPTVSKFYDVEVRFTNRILDILEVIQEVFIEENIEMCYVKDTPIVIHERLQIILPTMFLVKECGLQEGDQLMIL